MLEWTNGRMSEQTVSPSGPLPVSDSIWVALSHVRQMSLILRLPPAERRTLGCIIFSTTAAMLLWLCVFERDSAASRLFCFFCYYLLHQLSLLPVCCVLQKTNTEICKNTEITDAHCQRIM